MAKILILTNNDVGLYKFRKELIEQLLQEHEVYISLPFGDFVPKLESIGCTYIQTPLNRRGMNPFADMKLLMTYINILRDIKPGIALTYTIKPNIYGGIACGLLNIPYISTVTGLGSAIQNGGLLKKLTLTLYKIGLKNASCVYFQNKTNLDMFLTEKIINGRVKLIPGSGVNLEHHRFEVYPAETSKLRFLYIGRIMKEKGIEELMMAAQKVKEIYPDVRFHLIGSSEEDYRDKITTLEKQGIIRYHGLQEDVHQFIAKAHAVIHPSYHEGLSNVLLEAASTGRPVLASGIPGCMETFDEGISGIGFEARNAEALYEAIIKFIELPHDRKKAMGEAGRIKVEKEFDRKLIVDTYINEIKEIV
jgi:galacturonosyltransferase